MASVVGAKTSTVDINPAIPVTQINAIWGTAPQDLTVGQIHLLLNCLATRSGGGNYAATIGVMFP